MIQDGKIVLTGAAGGESTITIADVFQSNGVIHVIDAVLMPDRHQGSQVLPQQRPQSLPADRDIAPDDRQSAPATGTSEYSLGDELESWKKGLKSGAVEYRVPKKMTAQTTSTITVVIHGYQDTQNATMTDRTGSGTLKVSSRMKAELVAPLNPGEFSIALQGTDAIQFIPNDGFATWMWTVTPNYEAKNQQLQVRISLVYQGKDGTLEQTLEENTYPVEVDVQNLGVTILHAFWKDPLGWFSTGWGKLAALVTSLGGISGIIAWWRGRGKTAPEKPTQPKGK
jgi:hypothetical protein